MGQQLAQLESREGGSSRGGGMSPPRQPSALSVAEGAQRAPRNDLDAQGRRHPLEAVCETPGTPGRHHPPSDPAAGVRVTDHGCARAPQSAGGHPAGGLVRARIRQHLRPRHSARFLDTTDAGGAAPNRAPAARRPVSGGHVQRRPVSGTSCPGGSRRHKLPRGGRLPRPRALGEASYRSETGGSIRGSTGPEGAEPVEKKGSTPGRCSTGFRLPAASRPAWAVHGARRRCAPGQGEVPAGRRS